MLVAHRISQNTSLGFHVPALVLAGVSFYLAPFILMWWFTKVTLVVTLLMIKVMVIFTGMLIAGSVALAHQVGSWRHRTTTG